MASSESMLALLQDAVALNNKAVGLMMAQQNTQGIACFQTALCAMKEASIANDSQPKVNSSLFLAHSIQILRSCITSSFPRTQEEGYVYNHFFLFKEGSIMACNSNSEALIVLCSATVLFNFGLALHKDGRQRRSESSIHKALFVYDLAYDLLTPCAMEIACEAFAALIAVVLNNTAQLCLELCEFRNAEHRLQNLGRVLQSKYVELCHVLSVPVVNELHLNFLVSHIPYASHAA